MRFLARFCKEREIAQGFSNQTPNISIDHQSVTDLFHFCRNRDKGGVQLHPYGDYGEMRPTRATSRNKVLCTTARRGTLEFGVDPLRKHRNLQVAFVLYKRVVRVDANPCQVSLLKLKHIPLSQVN